MFRFGAFLDVANFRYFRSWNFFNQINLNSVDASNSMPDWSVHWRELEHHLVSVWYQNPIDVVKKTWRGPKFSFKLESTDRSWKAFVNRKTFQLRLEHSDFMYFKLITVGMIPISHFQHKTLHFLSFSNYTFQLHVNHYLVRMQSYLIANE